MLGTETRWSLVVLRKAIFSREFSSPFLKKHSQAVQQLPCAAPQNRSRVPAEATSDEKTQSHSAVLWIPREGCCPQQLRPAALKWLPANEPGQTKGNSSPICVHAKERGVNTPCHPQAYLLPAQWLHCCGSPNAAHCIILKGVRKATLSSHLPVWSSSSVCWDRGWWRTLMDSQAYS